MLTEKKEVGRKLVLKEISIKQANHRLPNT